MKYRGFMGWIGKARGLRCFPSVPHSFVNTENMEIRLVIEEDGTRTEVKFEGKLCKERVIRDVVGWLTSSLDRCAESTLDRSTEGGSEELSIRDRLEGFLRCEYPRIWFTSSDVKNEYERIFDEKVNLSTVSTYLARMHREGVLDRKGNRAQREYRLSEIVAY
jgi:hypothetical protein